MKKYIISEDELDDIAEAKGMINSIFILLADGSSEERILDWVMDNLETFISNARLSEHVEADLSQEIETRLSDIESSLEATGSMMMTNGSIVCAIENRYKDIERSLKLIDECLGIHERKLNKLMLSEGVE